MKTDSMAYQVELYREENGPYTLFGTENRPKAHSPSSDGYFSFCVPPGNHYIKVIMPPYGLVNARANIGNNEEIDSDIDHSNGKGTTPVFYVSEGQNRTQFGAGYYPMGQGAIWFGWMKTRMASRTVKKKDWGREGRSLQCQQWNDRRSHNRWKRHLQHRLSGEE